MIMEAELLLYDTIAKSGDYPQKIAQYQSTLNSKNDSTKVVKTKAFQNWVI
jgi:hypothetical protein